MKNLALLLFPLLALAAGAFSWTLSGNGLETVYPLLALSPLTPPGAVFPVVWTILYLLMGLGLALVVRKGGPGTSLAVVIWVLQLAVNVIWSPLFFGRGDYLAALLCLGVLWLLILLMLFAFHSVSRAAAWLQIPYFLWVSFAGYLNYTVWALNR